MPTIAVMEISDQTICALEGIRTPNLLIRSQMLYPLSYERVRIEMRSASLAHLEGLPKIADLSAA